jgi:putative transposase
VLIDFASLTARLKSCPDTKSGPFVGSSRFLDTLARLGITHRRTAAHHPEGNSYIERFDRSLKEEEVWTTEYRSLEEARASVARWIEEYNDDQPPGKN